MKVQNLLKQIFPNGSNLGLTKLETYTLAIISAAVAHDGMSNNVEYYAESAVNLAVALDKAIQKKEAELRDST